MRYIQKLPTPEFFSEDTQELQKKIVALFNKKDKKLVWDNDYTQKRKLKEYILEYEQNYLCCYCEAKVTLDDSHIEHIKPKDMHEDTLTFDYHNLAVSCDGICYSSDNKPITCGHKKGSSFDESKFLNPTTIIDIRSYFIYTDNFYIGASNLDETKAKYTLELLQLNAFNNYLPYAREIALQEFKKSINGHVKKSKKSLDEVIRVLLDKENLAFISFLRFKYKHVIGVQQ